LRAAWGAPIKDKETELRRSVFISLIAGAVLIVGVGISAHAQGMHLFGTFTGSTGVHHEASGARTESPEPAESPEPSPKPEPTEKPEPSPTPETGDNESADGPDTDGDQHGPNDANGGKGNDSSGGSSGDGSSGGGSDGGGND
jgi:outer membrane biosynthesis protein TonB